MSQPSRLPLVFWRAWLLFSARIFMRVLLSLCVAWALFASVLPLFAPPPLPPSLSAGPHFAAPPPGPDE